MKNEIDQQYDANVSRAQEKLEAALRLGDAEKIKRAQAELEHARGALKSENYNKED